MPNFKKYSYDQSAMVVINFEEQLQPGTFEFTLHKLIDSHIDLSVFHEKYTNDAGGRTAYDPAILLKIILYAYSKGITSSREIQWQCEHNIIFKALSCDSVPHFTGNESAKMTTSKGTIQGYNGVAAVDKKHQIVVDAQAFGEGQEHHILKPVLTGIKERFARTNISDDIYKEGAIVTADTGFSNEANNQYLYEEKINAYIPDNQFRSRDKAFVDQKEKYGKRHQDTAKGIKPIIPSSEFTFNKQRKTCVCPQGKSMWVHREHTQANGKTQILFEGKLTDCRVCPIKALCMRNPEAANDRKGHGRIVSFTYNTKPTATDWMKKRVDSRYGKVVYGHRMSTVEPVFANICVNKGLNRFSLRGKSKVQGQWQLYCLVYNIEKLMNYGAVA